MPTYSVKLLILPLLLFLHPLLTTNGIIGNFGDIYQYAAPFRHFAAATLQEGILPLWNPYIFAGTPFLASPQSSLFYPLSTLFYFLPLNLAFNYTALLHLFLSSLGMFLFLHFLRFSRSAALLGTLLWGFSFFPLSKLAAGHIIHLTGYSWFPWVLMFYLCTQTRGKGMGAGFISLVLSSVIQFFSGHLHVWILTTFMLFILSFWKSIKSNWGGRMDSLKLFFIYFICFLLISAIQFLPSLNYLLRSSRGLITESSSIQSIYIFATSYSMRWKDLISVLIPNYFGNPLNGNYRDPLHPSIYFETNTFYYGFLPFFFSLLGILLLLKKRKFLLPILIAFFTLLALGKNSIVYNWMWELFSFLRVPARFFFLSFFCMICAAAFFWDHSFRKLKDISKILIIVLILLDLWHTGKKFIWSENHLEKIGRSNIIEWLQGRLHSYSAKPPSRIFTAAEIGNPNKTMFFRILNVNGYEAILQKSLLKFFAVTQGTDALLTTGIDLKNPESRAIKQLAVKYMITLNPLKSNHPLVYETNQVRIYEELQPFSFLSSDFPLSPYKILKNSPNKWVLVFPAKEKRPWRFFFSQAYYPGWKAWTENGTESKVLPWNGYLQTLNFIEPETKFQKIFILFSPWDFTAGCLITLISLILFALLLFRRKLSDDMIKYLLW